MRCATLVCVVSIFAIYKPAGVHGVIAVQHESKSQYSFSLKSISITHQPPDVNRGFLGTDQIPLRSRWLRNGYDGFFGVPRANYRFTLLKFGTGIREWDFQGIIVRLCPNPRLHIIGGSLPEVLYYNGGEGDSAFCKPAPLYEQISAKLTATTVLRDPYEPCSRKEQSKSGCGQERFRGLHSNAEGGPELGTVLVSLILLCVGFPSVVFGAGRWGDGSRLGGGILVVGGVVLGFVAIMELVVG